MSKMKELEDYINADELTHINIYEMFKLAKAAIAEHKEMLAKQPNLEKLRAAWIAADRIVRDEDEPTSLGPGDAIILDVQEWGTMCQLVEAAGEVAAPKWTAEEVEDVKRRATQYDDLFGNSEAMPARPIPHESVGRCLCPRKTFADGWSLHCPVHGHMTEEDLRAGRHLDHATQQERIEEKNTWKEVEDMVHILRASRAEINPQATYDVPFHTLTPECKEEWRREARAVLARLGKKNG